MKFGKNNSILTGVVQTGRLSRPVGAHIEAIAVQQLNVPLVLAAHHLQLVVTRVENHQRVVPPRIKGEYAVVLGEQQTVVVVVAQFGYAVPSERPEEAC